MEALVCNDLVLFPNAELIKRSTIVLRKRNGNFLSPTVLQTSMSNLYLMEAFTQ